MKRVALAPILVLLAALAAALASLPAAWLSPLLERQTDGRLSLGDPEGSVWDGSAFMGVAGSADDALVPLLPGRFRWRLSPLALVGIVDATVQNPRALAAPVRISGSWRHWEIGDGSLSLSLGSTTSGAATSSSSTTRPSGATARSRSARP